MIQEVIDKISPCLEQVWEDIDGLANMEPRAGMRIERIRERFGDRFFVWGNICNTEVLPSNQQDQIRHEVNRVLSAATDGGYMGLSFAIPIDLAAVLHPAAVVDRDR